MIYETPEKILESNADKIMNDIEKLILNNENVVLDMKNTVYISSAALRVFLISWKLLKIKGYEFRLINTTPLVEEILKKTNLLELLVEGKTR